MAIRDEQRATFARLNIAEDGTTQTYLSMTVKKVHALLGLLVTVIVLFVSLLTLRGAVYGAVREVAADEFQRQLNVFHIQAKPEIGGLIDAKIVAHSLTSESIDRDRIVDLRAEISGLTAQVATLNEKASRNQRLLEELLSR